jgi:hypothetical protein
MYCKQTNQKISITNEQLAALLPTRTHNSISSAHSSQHSLPYRPTINITPLNAELNPICHLLALLGGATIVVVSRLRVNLLLH